MNFKSVSNSEVLARVRSLCEEERRITTEVLWHLREIQVRRIFAEVGYSSLHEFCVRELKYSDGAAHRRIAAMQALVETPHLEGSILSGLVSLTTVAQVQDFLKAEMREKGIAYSADEKKKLFLQMEGKSKRETEKILAEISPDNSSIKPKESERQLTQSLTELKIILNGNQMEKIERIMDLTAHTGSYAELLEKMADIALAKLDPEKKVSKKRRMEAVDLDLEAEHSAEARPASPEKRMTRYVPAAIRKRVWIRDQGRCTYQSPATQKRCDSRFGLELDHKKPYAAGGVSTEENLRLVCKAHNQLYAIQNFGLSHMRKFLK